MKKILEKNFGVKVNKEKLKNNKSLKGIRSYYAEADKTLFINSDLKESQINSETTINQLVQRVVFLSNEY